MDRPTCSSGLDPPPPEPGTSLTAPAPSHPPSSARGQGHRKGQHPDRPSVRRPCVVGRLSRPKLRSTAIVGGRRACGLGGELRQGWGASPTPAVTPGLQGLNPTVCRWPTSTCTPHIVHLSQPVLHPPSRPTPLEGFALDKYQDPVLFQTKGNQAIGLGELRHGPPLPHRPAQRGTVQPLPRPVTPRPSASVGPALSPPWLAPPIFLAEAALGSRTPLPSPSVRLHLPQERGGGSGPRMSAAPGDGP